MEMVNVSELRNASQPGIQSRLAYAAPELVVYGNLIDLTATGSNQTANESGSEVNLMCGSNLNAMSPPC